MLELKKIVKEYSAGGTAVEALRGVSLAFRKSEFVAVLGPSGCGKTTLLNIIGGLDAYTTGDLVINGVSTKKYRDKDWDAYRNHSVGFVFQSYNLIPHQTVLANVELALTLSGIGKAERRMRAAEALDMVGLGDQLKKKPNQMSGGQMQRVAIARALVNNPDILLADEPTGALDTQTSVQIMELLKEISKDRLIIMVTHNPELADQYSTRTVRLLDGEVVGDTNPYTPEKEAISAVAATAAPKKTRAEGKEKKQKRSMSFFTALTLSFNNLMTKRARTLLTSFAGSIGIIGISLILALSTGVQTYIDNVQRDTLIEYPITITTEESMVETMLSAMQVSKDVVSTEIDHEKDAVYSSPQMFNMFNAFFAEDESKNNLTAFKKFLDRETNKDTATTELYNETSVIRYGYDVKLNCFVKNAEGKYVDSNPSAALSSNATVTGGTESNAGMYGILSEQLSAIELWEELLPGSDGLVADSVKEDYVLLYGDYPKAANEVILILNRNCEISDLAFYSLGLMSESEIKEIVSASLSGKEIPVSERKVSYEDVCNIGYKLLLDSDYYTDKDGDGVYEYIGDDEALLKLKLDNAYDLKISGVVRMNDETESTPRAATFGYTSALTEYAIGQIEQSKVINAQLAPENENFDVLTGLPFVITEAIDPSDEYKAEKIKEYFSGLSATDKAELYKTIKTTPDDAYINETIDAYLAEYDTRDKLTAAISESYGMSKDEIQSYIGSYSDEELVDMVRENMKKMVAAQYAETASAELSAAVLTPTEQELSELVDMAMARFSTDDEKRMFVLNDWMTNTSIPDTELGTILYGMTAEQLDAAAREVAGKAAGEMYQKMAAAEPATLAEKTAALFDAEYAAETDTEKLVEYYNKYMPSTTSPKTLAENLTTLGNVRLDTPSSVNIYASTFESKDKIAKIIEDYNTTAAEEDRIEYTDYVALLMSGITDIINAISFGLIFFVAISLVVSSIMIGIITYISVLERTKEIGVLRSIGASKRDVSMVFNAETLIVGLTAGLMGVGISLLLCIPINLLIHGITGVYDINAFIQPLHAVILVAISMLLTIIAGVIPSRMAAKKDPVEALRTE